jgi:AcrR family transcriptional regulator
MNKRKDILAAALQLFVERGEQSTSMRCVGKAANCGIGTMYNYFHSKDDLISELYLVFVHKVRYHRYAHTENKHLQK